MNANACKWVAALESGEYEQGMDFLMTTDNKYCCLGVACAVYNKSVSAFNQVVVETVKDQDGDYITVDGHAGTLPERVRKWLGLTYSNGEWNTPSGLSDMNDAGKSFQEIAVVIKSEPKGLFEYK
jgi:hypothetical protein